jgi:hypothetical protein
MIAIKSSSEYSSIFETEILFLCGGTRGMSGSKGRPVIFLFAAGFSLR